MTARANVAAHLDLSTSRLKGLIESKIVGDAEGLMAKLDAARDRVPNPTHAAE